MGAAKGVIHDLGQICILLGVYLYTSDKWQLRCYLQKNNFRNPMYLKTFWNLQQIKYKKLVNWTVNKFDYCNSSSLRKLSSSNYSFKTTSRENQPKKLHTDIQFSTNKQSSNKFFSRHWNKPIKIFTWNTFLLSLFIYKIHITQYKSVVSWFDLLLFYTNRQIILLNSLLSSSPLSSRNDEWYDCDCVSVSTNVERPYRLINTLIIHIFCLILFLVWPFIDKVTRTTSTWMTTPQPEFEAL